MFGRYYAAQEPYLAAQEPYLTKEHLPVVDTSMRYANNRHSHIDESELYHFIHMRYPFGGLNRVPEKVRILVAGGLESSWPAERPVLHQIEVGYR